MAPTNRGRMPNNIPVVNNDPFAYDALPLDQPPTREEIQFFDHETLRWPAAPPPLRRSLRYFNQQALEFDDPSLIPHRTCIVCGGVLWRDTRGRCAVCWRDPHAPPAPVPRQPYDPMCYCPCRCPPEQDDSRDAEWLPDTNHHSGVQIASTLIPNRPVAYGMIPQANGGPPIGRNYMPETSENYRTGIVRRISDPALAHTVNEHNLVDAWSEVVPLWRYINQAEIAHFLAQGYTRNQIRERFPETADGRFQNYLPPDLIQQSGSDSAHNSHEAQVCQEEHCPVCSNPYTARDQRAINRFRHIRCLLAGAAQHLADGDTDVAHDCAVEVDRLNRFMAIELCRLCSRPMPVQNLHRDWSDGHCGCVCGCFPDRTYPSSQSSSGSGERDNPTLNTHA